MPCYCCRQPLDGAELVPVPSIEAWTNGNRGFVVTMRGRRFHVVALVVAIIAGCVALSGCGMQPVRPNVAVNGTTLLIEGRITDKTARKVHEALAARDIVLVQLNSGGGDVEPSLDIATEIFMNGLDVEVTGNCLSSCANYLFPAGRNKTISGPGVVGWHGSIQHLVYLHESGKRVMVQPTYEGLVETAQREADFFAMVGVDSFICWFGKVEPFNVRNFYFLSVEDMERFGISNVSAREDYPATDTDYMDQFFFISNLERLDVDWARYQAVPPKSGLRSQ